LKTRRAPRAYYYLVFYFLQSTSDHVITIIFMSCQNSCADSYWCSKARESINITKKISYISFL